MIIIIEIKITISISPALHTLPFVCFLPIYVYVIAMFLSIHVLINILIPYFSYLYHCHHYQLNSHFCCPMNYNEEFYIEILRNKIISFEQISCIFDMTK